MTFRVLNSIFGRVLSPPIDQCGRASHTLPIVAALFVTLSPAVAQTNDPAISIQPASGTVMLDEDWGFNVQATGTSPFSYQWQFNGAPLVGETNSTLEIPTIISANAGTYSVVVTNAFGRVTSENATLAITDTPPRTIRNGNLITGTTTRVPILFAGNGREQSVSFSLSYDTNIFTNPSWVNLLTNATPTLDLSQASNGHVGLAISLPGQFPPTNALLGEFVFGAGTNQFAARLQFTNAPTAFEAVNTNATSLQMQGGIIPQVDLLDNAPILNNQSGLMEQRLTISYAGAVTITNVDIAVGNLSVDSLTNTVTLYNGIGTKSIDVTGFGDVQTLPYAGAGTFVPGTEKDLTMEYYVPDRVTAPAPEYYLDLGEEKVFNVAAAATPLDITIQTPRNGTIVIQFNSVAGFVYYVQYRNENDVNELWNSVDPPIAGTGYAVQWIDNGPPKTESPPIDGMRFYRVVELPGN